MDKLLFDINDFCQLTGLTKSSAYKITSKRLVGFYKPFGKKIYFTKEQLLDMLTKVRVKSIDEIKAELEKKGPKADS